MTTQINKEKNIIIHIINYCKDISDTISRYGKDYEVFIRDKDYYKSLSMSVFQISELTMHLSPEFKAANSSIEWGDIKAMRNRFAHRYAAMDPEIIWQTAIESIPKLHDDCAKILQDYDDINKKEVDGKDDFEK